MRAKIIPTEALNQILSDHFKNLFWSHVIIGGEDECWPWTGYIKKNGYGQTGISKKFGGIRTLYAHRVAWIVHTGSDAPDGLCVLHSCVGRRSCCNWKHLRIGTHTDNMREMHQQGRQFKNQGELNPLRRLTNEIVLEIRTRFKEGQRGQLKFAREIGISASHMRNIVARKRWAHI